MSWEIAPETSARLEKWFGTHQRPLPWRDRYDPWRVWVSEIMLQQTRMEVVLRSYDRFIERFPTASALANASLDQVLAAWSGLGYYRRARMLHAGARLVSAELGGTIPSSVPELLRIPGIGRYTAGAISSIAFDLPAPIVDGNVARVVARMEAIEAPVRTAALQKRAWAFAEALVGLARSPRAVNQAMMELGAQICTPRRPRCGDCPIQSSCRASATSDAERFPRPAARRETVALTIPIYLVRDARGCVLMRREGGVLMAGMLHLPHGESSLLTSSADDFERGPLLGRFRHTITNRRIQFEVYVADPRDGRMAENARDYLWIDPLEIASHPHPSYVGKALRLALDARDSLA